MKLGKARLLDLYRTMVRIRLFEEEARTLFLDGKLAGFLHLYSGEEAVAAGVCAALSETDCLTSTHRGHGHCIAKGASMNRMMAELFGKATGYSRGKGGSMHIADLAKGVIGANGIVGASMPTAAGVAYAQKRRGQGDVTVAFFGDGASNRGTFHESANMASVWDLPLVFVCENNGFGMSTPAARHMKVERVAARGASYDIPGATVDGNDPVAVYEAAEKAVKRARAGKGPSIVECLTWRHHGHFVGDPAPYKKKEDQERWLLEDPIPRFEKRLTEQKTAKPGQLEAIKAEARAEVDASVAFALESPLPGPEELFSDLYMQVDKDGRGC